MDNQTPEYRLKIYSILFVVLAVLDIAQLVGGYFTGALTVGGLVASAGVDASLALTSLIITYAIATIVILLKLVLGFKGYRQSQGSKEGTAHIKLAWVALVIIGIAFIGTFVSFIKGSVSWYSLLTPLVSLCILGAYIKDAKAIKQA